MKAKKLIGSMMKAIVGFVVLAYLALHTINFFQYTFPPDQVYYAYLGFGLTGLGAVAYLLVFLWDADTPMKRTISLIMVVVCGLGEILAASFGMRIEAWAKNGWVMTEADFSSMMLAIEVLAFIHLIALVLYVASEKIVETFSDKDQDGIPDGFDPIDNRSGQPFKRGKVQIPAPLATDTQEVHLVGQGNGKTADPTQRQR